MRTFLFAFALFWAQPLWAQEAPKSTLVPSEYKEIKKKEKGVLVDVRTPQEFQSGHLKKAVNSDFKGGQFNQEFKNWDKQETYYLYCASGNRSGQALKLMQEAGFTKVYNLGGFKDLEASGLRVKKAKPSK
ncbi:rhodanese-like domain-containing protein [Rufibacter latericius]|uniref:Rhodanese-like domain-containing protein n=1 Tax=Rufibacter latericius TaxID=2487040 RepID=A0A3M9MYL4_9BACT|nr:rhodanese-like domain-containing protein [Rufibacter latericius]RNI30642.1 rhodanese-like domain-containing protein [Rufibacter latericius]